MIWDKVGFVLASQQRLEIFRLIKDCKTIEGIKSKVVKTRFTQVKRILKDFSKENLVRIKNDKVELTALGRRVLEKFPQFVCK
jgi:predicted transcriptional regulator